MGRNAAIALAVLAVVALTPGGEARGGCAGPQLGVPADGERRPVLTVGSAVTVRGVHFMEGCNDTGGDAGVGCSGPEPEIQTPLRDVALILEQGNRKWDLGERDAGTEAHDDFGRIEWRVIIPRDVLPGRATLVADGGARQPIRVRRAG